jgi:hypothetical protein
MMSGAVSLIIVTWGGAATRQAKQKKNEFLEQLKAKGNETKMWLK